MNWGTKITIVLGLFISGMTYMVYVCMKQTDIQLVATDYYEQEVNYQAVIDKKNNYDALIQKPHLVFDPTLGNYILDFSKTEEFKSVQGSIVFFRPSHSTDDKKLVIELNEKGVQYIDKSQFSSGKWIVKLDWTNLGKEYFNEQTVWIP